MIKEFTCEKCDTQQEQMLVHWGGFAYTTCWSCGEREFYLMEYKSNLSPEQEKFWEQWRESLYIWRRSDKKDLAKYGDPYSQQAFKNFHNERVHGIPVSGHEKAVTRQPDDIKKCVTHNGWIAPDGKFYECGIEQHLILAEELVRHKIVEKPEDIHRYQQAMDKARYIKLQEGYMAYSFAYTAHRLTQQQKETVIDYFTAQNKNTVQVFSEEVPFTEFIENY